MTRPNNEQIDAMAQHYLGFLTGEAAEEKVMKQHYGAAPGHAAKRVASESQDAFDQLRSNEKDYQQFKESSKALIKVALEKRFERIRSRQGEPLWKAPFSFRQDVDFYSSPEIKALIGKYDGLSMSLSIRGHTFVYYTVHEDGLLSVYNSGKERVLNYEGQAKQVYEVMPEVVDAANFAKLRHPSF